MLGKARSTGYKPVSKYEEHLADQIEALPKLRQQKREFYFREIQNDRFAMIPRAQAAGVDFDRLWAGYPTGLEPDVEAFMDRMISYGYMMSTIREVEAYAKTLEAQRQVEVRSRCRVFHTIGSALQDAFK